MKESRSYRKRGVICSEKCHVTIGKIIRSMCTKHQIVEVDDALRTKASIGMKAQRDKWTTTLSSIKNEEVKRIATVLNQPASFSLLHG